MTACRTALASATEELNGKNYEFSSPTAVAFPAPPLRPSAHTYCFREHFSSLIRYTKCSFCWYVIKTSCASQLKSCNYLHEHDLCKLKMELPAPSRCCKFTSSIPYKCQPSKCNLYSVNVCKLWRWHWQNLPLNHIPISQMRVYEYGLL